MICNPYEIIIQGITSNGREFRPSDWAERLSGILSTFGVDQKLSYAPFVRPMVHNNVRCVAVDKQLEKIDPRVFEFIMTFARDNDLRVVDCRSLIQESDLWRNTFNLRKPVVAMQHLFYAANLARMGIWHRVGVCYEIER